MDDKKNVSIVGTVGVPAKYGGFETLAEQLALRLQDNFNITVFCSKKKYTQAERNKNWEKVKRYFININANGPQSIVYDILSIIIAARHNDVILILGSSGTIILPFIKFCFRNTKIIFHPDGIEWKRRKWNVLGKLFLKISIKTGILYAHHVILDNKALVRYFNVPLNKTSFISYGGDHYHINTKENGNYWLTIARAEKENNLDLIAASFLHSPNEKWVLLSNFSQTQYGKDLFKEYSSEKNIELLNENYDIAFIGELLANCKGVIHGHSTGGTNPTLVAAMWAKKIIYCHNNPFNRETTNNKALYFSTINELIDLLKPPHPKGETEEIFNYAKRFFNWKLICSEYKKLFDFV